MTARTGLVGWPVAHSLSPRIHRHWIATHGLDATYELFPTEPEALGATVMELRREGIAGFNVTVPHKLAVLKSLDAVDDDVRRIGAANTVTAVQGQLHGSNTDAYGFIANLRAALGALEPYLKHVVLLGAGGAARAAIAGLRAAGAERIAVANRTATTAEALAREFHLDAVAWDARDAALARATLLVNTTSLGMRGKEPLTIDLAALPMRAAVHDIVYAPLETDLLRAAKTRGNPTVDGLGMLLFQAQKSFAHWHGTTPEVTPELRAAVLAP